MNRQGARETGKTLAVLGFGKMGEALTRGIARSQHFSSILVTDIVEERLNSATKQGFRATKANSLAAAEADVVLVAVKPYDVGTVLREIGGFFSEGKLLLSIAAGVPIGFIEGLMPSAKIVRAMPNITAAVREAVTAVSFNNRVQREEKEFALKIFGSVGEVVEVEESHLNVITALSGSGPGYMFRIIEALSEGAVNEGLSAELALKLSAHVAIGAGRMILETGKSPDELTRMVATPGGTTEAGLREMEEGKVAIALARAVASATRRAKELSAKI